MINTAMIGIVSMAILSVSFIFLYYLYHLANDELISSLNKDVRQINQQLTRDVETVFDVTNRLACDAELGKAVERFDSDELSENVEGKKMLDYILQNTIAMNQSINSVEIAEGSKIIRYNKYGRNGRGDMKLIKDLSWYEELLEDKVSWIFEPDNRESAVNSGSGYYLCATKFKTKFYEKREDENRIVIVSLQLSELENLIQNTANLKNMNVMIYDNAQEDIIYSKGVSEKYEKLLEQWGNSSLNKMVKGDGDFIILKESNKVSGWTVIGCVEKSIYQNMIYPVQTWLLFVIVLILAGTIFLSILILRNVSRPLKNVVKGMEDLGKQDFYSLTETGQYVEFEQLINTFNKMSMQIQEQIIHIEQKEREKRIEEFKVLEYQINPHFIYNTLDGIRWMALMNNSKPTAQIIGSFSNFLRLSLSKGKELIPVSQEIELTKEYVNIMIFRNNIDVRTEYDIQANAGQLYTLKMILQPVVENCFIHAFDKTIIKPEIYIRCYIDGTALVMEVTDNGKGFDGQENCSDKGILTGLGINNIEERVKLWHGDNYGIHIKGMEQGTMVTILQPILRDIKEDKYDTGDAD